MKKLLIATLISMVLGSAGGFAATYVQNAMADSVEECPAGTYEIDRRDGKPICKNEPTGCPYGDSIPLDSPKCAPPEDPETAYAPWEGNVPQPTQEELEAMYPELVKPKNTCRE